MPETITPAYDNKIYQKYSKKMIQNKEKNKIAFCQDFGLSYDKKIPLICITYPLTEKNNISIIQDVMNGLIEQPVQIVLMGIGTPKYQQYFTELSEKNQKQIVIVPDNDELLIEALIKPTDIDSVKKGQKALVRLSAYNYRTTPVLHGKVIYIDADRTVINQGENTKSGFKIKVKLDRNDLIHNKEFNLYPGMPADVYVILKEKSPLDYLLEPFEQSLFRAFRES